MKHPSFLHHLESHESSVYVFTDGSNSDTVLALGLRLYFLILTIVGLCQLMLLVLHRNFMIF